MYLYRSIDITTYNKIQMVETYKKIQFLFKNLKNGDPYETRTRVTNVRGWCPNR